MEALDTYTSNIKLNDSEENSNVVADKIARSIADESIAKRSVEWITSKGKCLDNLVPQISTLPHAGRGAFAQRLIAEGEVIVPAPILQMMNFTTLSMYGLEFEDENETTVIKAKFEDEVGEDGEHLDGNAPVSTQLISNYCFSHDLSSMLLCPQTNSILLNHCSTRVSYGGDCEKYNQNEDQTQRGANAEIRWATEWDPDTKQWLKFSVEDIVKKVKEGKRGLSLDIVATRDIHPGEEVFLDYGEGWEDDWEEHVNAFVPPQDENYIPVKEFNDNMEHLRSIEELEKEPYPMNVRTVCVYWSEEGEMVDEGQEDELEYPYTDEDWNTDGSEYIEDNEVYAEYGCHWPCDVLERVEGENGTAYTVEMFSNGAAIWEKHGNIRVLTNYPRESILFVPEKYESDQHLLSAFRSYIRIPDNIFPEQWTDMLEAEYAKDTVVEEEN